MENSNLIPRDISWLSFNYRVLQQVKDKSLPLLERIKFIAIYSSNLEEFFRVRVAQHQNLVRIGKKTQKNLDYDPNETLKAIFEIVNNQQKELSSVYEKQIIPELKKHNINLLRRLHLTPAQVEFIEQYFQQNMLPFVQPVLLLKNKIRPFLVNGEIYLAVKLKEKININRSREVYGLLNIPSDHLPRFLKLPTDDPARHDVIMLDDIVRHHVNWFFYGYEIEDAFAIKLSRDADLHIDDEYDGDLIEKIKSSLNKRNVGPASRFVYDRNMPVKMLRALMDIFDIQTTDALPEGRNLNKADFFKFPDFGKDELKYPPSPPLRYEALEDRKKDFFKAIRERDHLLYYPYNSYKSVVHFFEQAAKDEQVTHIEIMQYRVAKKSKIMKALMDAVNNGKKVSVFIEVKARFDEEANLQWGEALEQAGVIVNYSLPGIKVHSKLAMVRRIENEKIVLYNYLSTGNFNEDTAKIYTDFGLFTANEKITNEVAQVFEYLKKGKEKDIHFDNLLVGQFNLRKDLEKLIKREIKNAKAGKKARIQLKMNSLQDHEMIELLYEASKAGVKVQCIIRGICCLIPQKKKLSENIEVISIVDRFLEHARVFIFHNDGEPKVYISSADWMLRNLSYRVETSIPILDVELKNQIIQYFEIQWSDNTNARILDKEMTNQIQKNAEIEAINAQVETYNVIKNLQQVLIG